MVLTDEVFRSSRDDNDVGLSSFLVGGCPHRRVFLAAESHVGEVLDLAGSATEFRLNQKYFVGEGCKDNRIRHGAPDLADTDDSDLGG